MTLRTTNRFDKAFARLAVRDQRRVEAALTLFMDQPFHPALKNHGLTGKLRGLRAISAGYDLRIVYADGQSQERRRINLCELTNLTVPLQ